MDIIPDLSHRWQITYYIIIITINNAFEKWKNNVNVENWSSTSKGFLYHTDMGWLHVNKINLTTGVEFFGQNRFDNNTLSHGSFPLLLIH